MKRSLCFLLALLLMLMTVGFQFSVAAQAASETPSDSKSNGIAVFPNSTVPAALIRIADWIGKANASVLEKSSAAAACKADSVIAVPPETADASRANTDSVAAQQTAQEPEPVTSTYILNKNTKKFHYPNCGSVKQMKASNRKEYTGTRESVIAQGYSPCGKCKP